MFDWLQISVAGLWPIVWHFGVAGGLVLLCAAGVYFAPTLKRKLWFVAIGGIIAVFSIAVAIGVSLGEKHVRSQWNTALEKEAENGETARTDAVDSIGPLSADRGVFRGDPFNRDGGQQRGVK
jgi:hypothetical protein